MMILLFSGLAFLGGLLLNLMPCVFPILSLKVLGWVQHNHPKAILRYSLFFSLGILSGFWILFTFMAVLRTAGQSVGWGFQMQEPLFVSCLTGLFFILSMNFFGLFEFVFSKTTRAATPSITKPTLDAFLNGSLAVLVSTPCSAPFMGSALGFSLGQPLFISFIIFSALGLGMAFPYLWLGRYPSLLTKLPQPGPWMKTFKQLLGFPMLATALWLLAVLDDQVQTDIRFLAMVFFLGMGFLLWV